MQCNRASSPPRYWVTDSAREWVTDVASNASYRRHALGARLTILRYGAFFRDSENRKRETVPFKTELYIYSCIPHALMIIVFLCC